LKKILREQLLAKRDRIRSEARKRKEAAIRKRLFASNDLRKAKSILFYASFRSEVGTMECIEKALTGGKKVALPRVMKAEQRLRLYFIESLNDLVSGSWGILEPDTKLCKETGLDNIDVVITPGAGFDSAGNRLGYGAGYYDKLLSGSYRRPVIMALAFEEQIVPKLPGEAHDVKMNKIITDRRTIDCRKAES